MNWHAMLLVAATIAAACVLATALVWLLDRGWHPAMVLGVLFALAILFVGVAA